VLLCIVDELGFGLVAVCQTLACQFTLAACKSLQVLQAVSISHSLVGYIAGLSAAFFEHRLLAFRLVGRLYGFILNLLYLPHNFIFEAKRFSEVKEADRVSRRFLLAALLLLFLINQQLLEVYLKAVVEL